MAALVACRSSDGGSRKVIVTTMGGDEIAVGTTVIGHAPDGSIIDETRADAVGRAEVGVDDDSFVSVVYPSTLDATTSVISLVTVPAPEAEVTVHGPPRNGTPGLVVGVLQVTARRLNAAAYFEIQLGCANVRVMQLPATIDVGACSMGSDTELDVLVTGYSSATPPVLVGYGAARVPMVDGVAMIDVSSWPTTGTNVPVTLDGVMPTVEMTLYADGLSFGTQLITNSGTVWDGLVVDHARVTATLSGIDAARITTREIMGAPTSIALAASDFLAPITTTATIEPGTPLTIRWDAMALGDAVNLHASWQIAGKAYAVPTGPHAVVWDAVLPPDATSATLPAFAGELSEAIAPDNVAPADVVLRYVDSTALDGFAALAAAGIHVDETGQPSTVAPRPTSGDVKATHAIGLR